MSRMPINGKFAGTHRDSTVLGTDHSDDVVADLQALGQVRVGGTANAAAAPGTTTGVAGALVHHKQLFTMPN